MLSLPAEHSFVTNQSLRHPPPPRPPCLQPPHLSRGFVKTPQSTGHDRSRRRVLVAGLLDSWRRDQGLATAPAGQQQQEEEEKRRPGPPPDPIAERAAQLLSTDDDLSYLEDDELCTAECVTEVRDLAEFQRVRTAVGPRTLVVVDFYKTSCGACRFIAPKFVKLCRASCDEHGAVRFLKHNIFDEADELTDLAEHLRIRGVPYFYFYRDGELLERFAGGDKLKIASAINKHAVRPTQLFNLDFSRTRRGWEVLHV